MASKKTIRKNKTKRVETNRKFLNNWINDGKELSHYERGGNGEKVVLDKPVKPEDFVPLYDAKDKIRKQLPKNLFISHNDCILLRVQEDKVVWVIPHCAENEKGGDRWFYDITVGKGKNGKGKNGKGKNGNGENGNGTSKKLRTYFLHSIIFGPRYGSDRVKTKMGRNLATAIGTSNECVQAHHINGYIPPETKLYDVISEDGTKIRTKKLPLLHENENEIIFMFQEMHRMIDKIPDADAPFKTQKEYINKVRAMQPEDEKEQPLFVEKGDKSNTGTLYSPTQEDVDVDAMMNELKKLHMTTDKEEILKILGE